MLTGWHYIALLSPLLLFGLEWRRNRAIVISLLFTALMLAAAQGVVDVRIRMIRESIPYGVGSLDPGDPLRRHFGVLHMMSVVLMALQVIAAAVVVAMNARKTVYADAPAPAAAVAAAPPPPEPVPEPPPRVVDESLTEPEPAAEPPRDEQPPVAT